MTLPGPAFIHYRAGREHISRTVYPDLDEFWADLVAAYHAEMRSLAAAGCTYLQIDETVARQARRPARAGLLKARGDDWQDLLRVYVDVINAVVAGAPDGLRDRDPCLPQPGPELAGGCELRADRRRDLQPLEIGAYLLEWDDPRAGSFEPLRLSAGRQARRARPRLVADGGARNRRRDQAPHRGGGALHASGDQLALSPHCGFSTSARASDPALYEMERRKLARIVEVARAVWGE